MSKDIIEVENLSKHFRLGEINTGTLSHDITRWWHKLNGKPDLYNKLGSASAKQDGTNDKYVWSISDLSFSVKEGEVFGIVGKNGAGKSTLLKLLAKITKPTTGSIRLDGRIASLLEVGTGFHPDLTGRENVFLNGAILGMRKNEIRARFDQIVDFSGVEKFIDTPVKRYSSGMFVRLAFSVAAHLEPEILIIDEVLAVGDADFQQKCLGKMKDVSRKQGRTVLFVSHNMAAVKSLCDRALLLEKGKRKLVGDVADVLDMYQDVEQETTAGGRKQLPEDRAGYFLNWRLQRSENADAFSCYSMEEVIITTTFRSTTELHNCEFQLRLLYDVDAVLFRASSLDFAGSRFSIQEGIVTFSMRFTLPVRRGKYHVEFGLQSNGQWVDVWDSTTRLHVLDTYESHISEREAGLLALRTGFEIKTLEQVVPA